ncbi:MAG: AI-2E family transporter [Clostridia bacterium]|nr:AI-2E family transporter [Clostridia bacterium]
MQKNKSNFRKFWLPLFLFVVVVIVFYKVVDRLPQVFATIFDLLGILGPFIGGLVIAFVLYKPAYALETLCEKSEKTFLKKHARGISVLTCYLVLILLLAVMLYLLLPKIFESIVNLVQNLPTYYNSAVNQIKSMAGPEGEILGFDVNELFEKIDVKSILGFFDVATISKYASGIVGATGTIIDVFMAFVVSVYVLLDRAQLAKTFMRVLGLVIPKERATKFKNLTIRVSGIFYSYIYSQLIDCAIVSVLLFIVFSIIGVPYALLLAILMGLCNMIPYFGSIIGGIGVVLMVLVSSGDVLKAVIALVCIIVVQQIDANVIQPRIISESVGLRPVYVLLAIMIGSGLFGFIGILISVPVMAVIKMIIEDYMKNLGGKDTPLVQKQKELAAEKDDSE